MSVLSMGKKGITSARGVGEIYNETKTEQVNLLLTKQGVLLLNALAKAHGLSRSELIEQIARGRLRVTPPQFSNPSQMKRLFFTITRSYMPPKP
ncbi:MAG: hypothetical protein SFY66_04365 [Oculatellaceae cyanobacterium bins.114]|nr:hypothetical protein [Oculatellaceae cyanobacterium bins.114]